MELVLFVTAIVILVVLMKAILHDKPVNNPCKNCKEDCNGCVLNKRK